MCAYLSSFLADLLLFFCLYYMFRLYVDGPFGSPSEEVFNYDVSLCVAGGIGVTPFACVLHALLWVMEKCHKLKNNEYSEQVFDVSNFFLPLFLPVVHPVMVGLASGCRGCILFGSAGSSSPFTGLLSCYVPFITRSDQSLHAVAYMLYLLKHKN